MRTNRPRAAVLVLLAGLLAVPGANADEGEARGTAERLVAWLAASSDAFPDRLLPERGTIQVELHRLGAARGAVGPRQASTLLREIRERGVAADPGIVAVDVGRDAWALVRVGLRHGDGAVELVLTLRREDGRWVLREIRESPR